MPSAKITFRPRPNKDGTISVILQIIHLRVIHPKVILRVDAADWDPKKLQVRIRGPHSVKQNRIIQDRLSAAKDYLLDCQARRIPPDPHSYLHGVQVGNDLVSHLQAKADSFANPRTKEKYMTCIMRINDAGLNIPVTDITEHWIERFDAVLCGYKNNPNTRAKYISAVGSVFTRAKRSGLITVNPFEGRPRGTTPGKKAKLTLDEFNRLRTVQLEPRLDLIRRLFVFAALARGMRAYDVLTLRWSDLVGDRLIYQAQKAGKSGEGKRFDIKVTPEMRGCLPEPGPGEYVFGLVSSPAPRHVDSVLAVVNRQLKTVAAKAGINKVLTMHVARHTFAFLSDQANVPLGTIQQLLGHGDITTTKIYVESIRRADDLDEAVEGVFNSRGPV